MTTKKKKVIDDSKVPQTSAVNECITLVTQAKAALGKATPALTKADRRRTPKPRTGSPEVIKTVARLATGQGIVIPKHPIGAMLQNLQTVQALAPLKASILSLLKVVDDTMLTADGQAWDSGTALYTVLRRVKGDDGDLEAELEPLSTFFKKGIKAPAKSDGATASPSVTSPAAGDATVHAAAAPVTAPASSGQDASSAPPTGGAGASTTHG